MHLVFPQRDTLSSIASEAKNFNLQPEIQHTFKPDDPKPNTLVSILFSLLTLSPWIGLLKTWSAIGVNHDKLKGTYGMKGIAFVCVLSAWIVLFGLYWTVLNLFGMLWYGSLLSAITFVVGRSVLVDHAVNECNSKSN